MTGGQRDLLGRFYSRMFDYRLESDYGEVVEFDREDMKVHLVKAEEFIARIKSLTESIGDGSL